MEGKVKLPQDLVNCPLSEIEAYINAHLPGGHKRRLAEALLTVRQRWAVPGGELKPVKRDKKGDKVHVE